MIHVYDNASLQLRYKELAAIDPDLQKIMAAYGHPPSWIRPNSFETLVLTILEQQVSLASAYAAYKKLKEKITITPAQLLALTDEELRQCYFSRQKIVYTRELARAIEAGKIDLESMEVLPDEEVRWRLKELKGIGDWTVDIYLIHALQRADIFPLGDLALINAIKMVKQLKSIDRPELLRLSEQWKPHRSAATMLFWHYYIRVKKIKLEY